MANNGNYSRKTIDITEIHSNIEQKLIQITEDRLKLILNQHIKNLGKVRISGEILLG